MHTIEYYLDLAIDSQQRLLTSLEEDSLDFDARAERDLALGEIRSRGVTWEESERYREKINLIVRLEQEVLQTIQAQQQRIAEQINVSRQRSKAAGVYASA